MGCIKSKRSATSADSEAARARSEKTYLVHSEDGSPRADTALLEYAQKLSEEIMARAVQQWAEVDRRYGDIPYIECDVP
ncbi:small membrane A-kinase anchor protein-like [Phyllopteryx taeniolatus]|uniref:small membrane A-kinase anchor protein-like n=1 Tax=Phyllopteryx taeniolatus TaxID=161469 RepID=UPI002AD4EE57|nr:small membrane A-kinase anchor protein-like [Phyllopteryx taeniolatus]